jgi:hypothetical protein
MRAVSPELAARIQGLIDDQLNGDPPPTWPHDCLRHKNALLLEISRWDVWGLRPDGTIFCMEYFDSIREPTEPVTDPGQVFDLLLKAARLYPALAEIVPFRKMRLFCCALVRRVWPLLSDPRSRRAIETAELFADSLVEPRELLADWSEACMVVPTGYGRESVGRTPVHDAAAAATCAALPNVVPPVLQAPNLPSSSGPSFREVITYVRNCTPAADPDRQVEKALLDCVFGDLSRPAAFDPAWRTDTTVGVARFIYDERAFDGLPVLADALEEAGCTDPAVLGHCRGGGEHTRGCWVVDLLLDRR